MRLLIAAAVLDAGTCGGEPDARRFRFLGHDAHGFEERCVAVAEPAGGGERARAGDEQLDALLVRRGFREQPECFAEPVCSTRRRPRGGCLSASRRHAIAAASP